MSMFRKPVSQDLTPETVIGGYQKDNGPTCPKCKSRDTEAIWRDPVWEETGCRCNRCGENFIKG